MERRFDTLALVPEDKPSSGGQMLAFGQGGMVVGERPVKRIVCLANSCKMSGRCVAGIELVIGGRGVHT